MRKIMLGVITLVLIAWQTNEGFAQTVPQPETAPAVSLANTPSPELVRVVFYRNSGTGLNVQPSLSLNGQPIGDSPVGGGYFAIERPPGEYEVTAKILLDTHTTKLKLVAGRTAYVRISYSFSLIFGSSLYPEVVDAAVGEKETVGLIPSGGPGK